MCKVTALLSSGIFLRQNGTCKVSLIDKHHPTCLLATYLTLPICMFSQAKLGEVAADQMSIWSYVWPSEP